MSEVVQRSTPGSSSQSPLPTLPKRAVLTLGSETVINLENRPEGGGVTADGAGSDPNSAIWRILFPDPSTQNGEPLAPVAGLELGHFRLEDRIRTGGMGAVFRATDLRLKRVVALKILPPAQSRDFSAVQRFRNEAQSAAQLDHENIARVYYIGEDAGLHYIAFEFVTGTNVREVIQQHGRLEPADAVNYSLQVASALVHTAAHGVVHRDIKPSNIIITPAGRAKLVDLGLARNENRESAELTLAGTTLGTFDYISPEQAKDPRSVDVRSDIYSLGCTLYHMLTGQPPYPEGTVLQKLLDHQAKEVPDPREKNRKVSEDLSAIVRKMMASDPRRRYQTSEQLIRDLMLIAGTMGLRSISPEGLIWMSSQPGRLSFWERHAGWLATVMALLLIVGWLKYNPGVLTGGNDQTELALTMPADDGHPEVPESRPTGWQPQSPSLPDNPTEPAPPHSIVPQRLSSSLTPGPETLVALGPPPAAAPTEAGSAGSAKPPAVVRTRADGGLEFTPLVDVGPTAATPPAQLASNDTGGGLKPGPAAAVPATPPATAPSTTPPDRGPTDPASAVAIRTPTNPTSPARPETPIKPETVPPATTPPVSPMGPIAILGRNDLSDQIFPTLEAACSAAIDGSVIELRFNGVRREYPLRVTKKVTIRAAVGYRPLLEMIPLDVPGEGFQTRMITVSSGSLDLVDLNLLMTVRDGVSTDLWALLSVQRAEQIRLQGVSVTIVNPQHRPAAVAEFRPGLPRSVMDMEMDMMKPRSPTEMEFTTGLVRGTADLAYVRHGDPLRISVRDAVVALDGTLLRSQGTMDLTAENGQIELRLDHVTAVLNAGLLRMDAVEQSRRLLPIQVSATNNIFSTTAAEPFVRIASHLPVEDLQQLVLWNGQKNFYDRFQGFWTIDSSDGLGRTTSLDFPGWRRHWGPGTEVDAHSEVVIWQGSWSAKPFIELTPADFALDSAAGGNPAISGASSGDAGVNLSRLVRLSVAPVPTHE